jgi:hypothetical protein
MAGDGLSWGAETVAIGRGKGEKAPEATGEPDTVALAPRIARSEQARPPRRTPRRNAPAPAWLRAVPWLAGGAALLVFIVSVVGGGGTAPIRDADLAPRPAIEPPAAARVSPDVGRRERKGGRKAPAPGLKRKLERRKRERHLVAAAVRQSSERSARGDEKDGSDTPAPPPAPEPEPAPAPEPAPEPPVETEAPAPPPETPAAAEFGM